MDREALRIGLLLSVPVAVGVAAGVLKQTLGSQPLVAGAAGLVAGGFVFGLVALATAGGSRREEPGRLTSLAGAYVPDGREATQRDLLVGAAAGAFVTVFLWYIPLSPLLGGAVAGALQGGTREDARTAGTLSGVLVPLVVLAVGAVVLLVFGEQVFGRFPFGPGAALAASLAGVVYAIGLGTVGGWVGGLVVADGHAWGNEA